MRVLFFRSSFLMPCLGLVMLVSCDAPVKTDPKTEAPTPAPPAEAPPVQTPTVVEAIQETEKPAEAAAEEPAPSLPLSPYLDVLENEAEKTITISGAISSQYQARDLYEGLSRNFPEMEVIRELKVDAQIPEVAWGNRVIDLLAPFIQTTEDAHFRYDKGVTLLAGTVGNKAHIRTLSEMTASIMEGPDARDIANKLKVKGE